MGILDDLGEPDDATGPKKPRSILDDLGEPFVPDGEPARAMQPGTGWDPELYKQTGSGFPRDRQPGTATIQQPKGPNLAELERDPGGGVAFERGLTSGATSGVVPALASDKYNNTTAAAKRHHGGLHALGEMTGTVAQMAGLGVAAAPLEAAAAGAGSVARFAARAAVPTATAAIEGAAKAPKGERTIGATTGALVGMMGEATVGSLMRRLVRSAPEAEKKAVIGDLARSETVTTKQTTRQQIRQDLDDIYDVMQANKAVKKAATGPAAEGVPVLNDEVARVTVERAPLYQRVDATTPPVTFQQLKQHLRQAADAAENPRQLAVVERMSRQLDDFWAKRWKVTPGTVPNGPIPTIELRKWVTDAQDVAAEVMGSIEGTPRYQLERYASGVAKRVLDQHLDNAAQRGAGEAVTQLREVNRQISALSTIRDAVKEKAGKEATNDMGLRAMGKKATRAATLAAAGGLAASGNPKAAIATVALPELARGTKLLYGAARSGFAALQEAAQAGKPLAEISRMALERGLPQGMARGIYNRYRPTSDAQK